MRRALSPFRAALAAALLAFGPLAAAPAQAQMQGVELDEPSPIAPFALTDQHGRPFTEADLKGRWSLIAPGFTYCPDVCPFVLASLQAVTEQMGLRTRPDNLPQVVFLSVDPERDAAVLADYMAAFNPDFRGVTGATAQIDSLIHSMDAFYRLLRKGPDDAEYEVQHSASVAVVDPDGNIRAKLQPPFGAGPTAEFLTRLAIEHRREARLAAEEGQ